MQTVRLGLAMTSMLVACSGEPSRAPRPPQTERAAPTASATSTPARVTACRARPSTVYGDEAVVFELEGDAHATAAVEVRDAAGRAQASARLELPAAWEVRNLGSGDFSLHDAASSVTCWVTVNRELSRASSSTR